MKRRPPLHLLLFLGLLCAGCVTEPGPEDTTVFGKVTAPKRVKVKTVSKPQPIINEVPELMGER